MSETPALTRKSYSAWHESLCSTVEASVPSVRVPVKLGMDNRATSILRRAAALLKTATDGTIRYLFLTYIRRLNDGLEDPVSGSRTSSPIES